MRFVPKAPCGLPSCGLPAVEASAYCSAQSYDHYSGRRLVMRFGGGPAEITVAEAIAELDNMIGLVPVKEQIRQIAASIEAARRRAMAGYRVDKAHAALRSALRPSRSCSSGPGTTGRT